MSDSKTMTVFVKADIENFSKNIANVEKNMNSVFGVKTMKMSKTFAKGLAAAASALGAFGAACIAMADHEQEVERTFTSLIGNADKAKKTLADLADWATNVPFDFEDMENASKKLLAYGVAAEDVVAVLNNLGNAAAMTGSGQAGIDAMTEAIGRMSMTGKVTSRDMKQLINQQVDAYRYLADYLGTDVASAMDQVKAGTVSGKAAVSALMQGMQTDFAGGMDNIEKSMSGMLGTMKYNVTYAMKAIGKELTISTGLDTRMAELNEAVRVFAVSIKNYGISETLKTMIPPELIVAIGAFGGVIMGIAVPALIALAAHALAAIVAIAGVSLPVLAVAAVIGAAFAVVMVATKELGELWFYTWESIKSKTATIGNAILGQLWNFASTALKYLAPILNFFGMEDTVKNWTQAVSENIKLATDDMNAAALKNSADSMGMDKAWENTRKALSGTLDNIKNFKETNNIDLDYKGLPGRNSEDAENTAATQDLGDIKKDVAKIAKTTEYGKQAVDNMRNLQGKIAFYAADGTNCMRTIGMAMEGTPFEGLINVDDAYAVAKKEGLDRDTSYQPKAGDIILVGGYDANGNWDPRMHAAMVTEKGGVIQNGKSHDGVWESDLTPQEMFGNNITGYIASSQLYTKGSVSEKASVADLKKKALDWESTVNSIKDKASDLARNVSNRMGLIDLTGVRKEFVETKQECTKSITDMERSYRDLALDYAKSTASEQEVMRNAWKESGLEFETIEGGRVSFAKQVAKERTLIEEETQEKIKALNYDRQKYLDDLDKAKNEGDISKLGELLSTEDASNNLRLENAQNFADEYEKLWKDANTTFKESFLGSIRDVEGTFSDFFTSVISGQKSLKDAFVDLLQSFINMIAEMVARWAAAQITQQIFGAFGLLPKNNNNNSSSVISVFGSAASASLFQRNASGGAVSGLTLVGEQGPELLYLNHSSRIFNNRDTRAIMGGGSVNMYVNTPDAESFKQSRAQISAGFAGMIARGRRNT